MGILYQISSVNVWDIAKGDTSNIIYAVNHE